MAGDKIEHPTPAQAYEIAVHHAALLRGLFLHPRFKYAQPPTADFIKPDIKEIPPALFFVSDFVQRTYVEYVVPFLPAGATRKCKAIANPWAYSDPDYKWEWEWDASTSELKDADGNVKPFPTLSEKVGFEKMSDIMSRGFLSRKIILENATDPKARLLAGGQTFDFGEEVEKLAKDTYEW
ncbi:hypothetical protein F4804DRAFT_345828 [Jackrogersella minutella]|nr:hypothetical protein F4804DRAFT_345828 [Jackrogersella minutella]